MEANRAPLEAAGLKKSDVIGKPFWETYWWSYSSEVQDQLKDALRQAANGETVRYDVPVRVAENRLIDIDVTFCPLLDSEGNVSQLLGCAVDITQRKQAEQQFRQLVEFAPDAMVIINNDREIATVNSQTETLFGYRREELIGQQVEVLMPERFREKHVGMVLSYLKEPSIQPMGQSVQLLALHKDGTEFQVEISLSPLASESGPFAISTIRDVTERLREKEELQRHQEKLAHITRLSTMGEMATGLAHELNQPLAAISTYCYSGEQALADKSSIDVEQLQELFEKLIEQALRAGEIIRRLRGFVSKSKSVRRSTNLNDLVQEVLSWFESDIRQNEVCVEKKMDQSIHPVLIDEVQIQQVAVNLIRNALDAMQDTERERRSLEIATVATPDQMIEVAVGDTGQGIPINSADQVFDAFFSSKSEGMGMGLAISRTIIKAHAGRLWMTPNSDQGVTFHFTLPQQSLGDGPTTRPEN